VRTAGMRAPGVGVANYETLPLEEWIDASIKGGD
jgi:hypothetical protein